MNVVFSLILLAAALGCIVFLLTRRENARRSQYGPSGLSEFRTDLPLDDCFDRLDQHSPDDEFSYECRRENDGGFLLHLTLRHPDLHPGGLWLQGAAFSAGNAGQVHAAEAGSPPHKIILPETLFISRVFCYTYLCARQTGQWGLVAQLVRAGGS